MNKSGKTLRKSLRGACGAARTGFLALSVMACTWAGTALGGQTEVSNGVLHIHNAAAPAHGTQTLKMTEMWRAGGEDDEIFFGAISQVLSDAEGDIYVLDQQLAQVQVYAADGTHLRTLGREGEGPGEVQRPESMLFLPDSTLGLVQYFPGKIVRLALDGTPAGSLVPGSDSPASGGFQGLSRAAYRGGSLVMSGSRMSPSEHGMQRTQYIAACTEEGAQETLYHEVTRTSDIASHRRWVEKDDYFPERDRWGLGPDGRVYIASHRDEYTIEVYTPSGELSALISRDYEAWRRTEAQKERVGEGLMVIVNGERMDIEAVVEDHAPALTSLWIAGDGSLWALSSRGTEEQPAGIMQTYDVFDPQGHFDRQVAAACPGDAQEDRLYFLGSDRAVLVKGAFGARQSMFGGGAGDDEAVEDELAPLEVIVYEISGS